MKKWLLAIGGLLIIVSAIVFFNIKSTVDIDTIYGGISIEDIDVSSKSKEEALNTVKDIKQEEIRQKSMKIKGQEKEYSLALEDIAFDYEYQEAVDSAYEIGREGNLFERYQKIKDLEKNKENIELKAFYDNKKIEEKSASIAKEINKEVAYAEFDFNGDNIEITDESPGYNVNEKELTSKIENNIFKLDDVLIPIETISPKYTKEYYSRINGVIGKSSTSFKTSGPGRVNNIKLSTKAFNGKIIHPGQSLSYNSTIGPTTTKAAYQNAPVIVAGDLTPGVGGGVCQTSTTLYNALLRADVKVTERAHHSIPSSYMDKGLDAVVAGNYLDLKFRNDFDYPIYISSWVENKTVHFQIYGDKKNMDYTIQMEPKITTVIPLKVKEILKNDLKPGTRELAQQGRNGYKVTTYKHKIKNGKVVETLKVSSDYYKERDTIYHIGPKVVAPTPPVEVPVEEALAVPAI